MTTQTLQLLTFRLDGQTYAVEISKVNEVMEYTSVTKIPRSPDFMLGLLNLRGNVVPVVDLRLQFGMAQLEPTIDTSIIIMDLEFEGKLHRIGALVDEVEAVVDISSEHVVETPEMGFWVSRRLIQQVVDVEGTHVVVLDMDTALSIHELKRLTAEVDASVAGNGQTQSASAEGPPAKASTETGDRGEAA